jgi:hypothetical protein
MAVVRCPRHGIPYNEDNPRGCPACAQERQGEADDARLMLELARASRGGPEGTTVEVLPPEPDPEEEVGVYREWPPVTAPPRAPVAAPGRLERFARLVRENWMAGLAVVLAVGGAWLLWAATRPTFEERFIPPLAAGDPRPFPVEPAMPMAGVFALLGTRNPEAHRDQPTLARYDFGDGAAVDALNGVAYAITLDGPGRTWHGHRVGSNERTARGALALEGLAREEPPGASAPFPFAGFITYRSLEAVPRRVFVAEVRPPNGCYDVLVEVRPQVIGTAARGDDRFVAVARRGNPVSWVTHRVRVVNRAAEGPYGTKACQAVY